MTTNENTGPRDDDRDWFQAQVMNTLRNMKVPEGPLSDDDADYLARAVSQIDQRDWDWTLRDANPALADKFSELSIPDEPETVRWEKLPSGFTVHTTRQGPGDYQVRFCCENGAEMRRFILRPGSTAEQALTEHERAVKRGAFEFEVAHLEALATDAFMDGNPTFTTLLTELATARGGWPIDTTDAKAALVDTAYRVLSARLADTAVTTS
jgi:hypothetical protein